MSVIQSMMGSKDTQIANQKKESDARIAALEKQLQESRSQQVSGKEIYIIMVKRNFILGSFLVNILLCISNLS